MKTILIKVYDRFPTKKGTYHCKRSTDSNEITLYFIPNMPHYVNKFKNVEYWWEEINLNDFIKEATDEFVKNSTKISEQFLHSMGQKNAEERYEKALKYWNDQTDDNGFVDVETTLRIAAGIKEDKL
jgi:hypothetical protein